ncbi:hypothetical protein [Acinetobacter towneri]|uniref:Transporter n=1 Tax=Acinetobacter towneri TaxID=202956 RepID=A0A1E8E2J0_9GAMM|nr:hypothetical protein [Acinetobacter towneri]OFE43608.1 hypothetical protein BJN41_05855 [Acinetobacter towneri]
MDRKWMNKTLLALSIQMVFGVAYAAEEPQLGEYETTTEQAEVSDTAASTADTSAETNSAVVAANGAQAASSALQQQEGDATKEANLEEVFTSNERQYSLMRQGEISSYYDIDYTYHRDTQLDLEMAQGQLYQLRVQENASHALTNTFTAQYGLRDNLTLSASLPLVAKSDLLKDATAAGLGDISLGARWEPFPLKAGRLPLILFANLSTKTGDSPYEINPVKDLSTGKGYYSAGIGASTRKYIDPVVLFASASANYGFKESDLNQKRGGRIIEEFEPGISGGFAFGFAYSFNYDVSMTMSYQQSFNTGSEFFYEGGESYSPADQTSSTLAISLGVRVSPETIVNGTVGIGLTEDAPDVSLGLSFPLDILGFGKKIR